MSLFPILNERSGAESQSDRPISDKPTEWLSNNASYQSHDVLEPYEPYGNYATQAEFLRAAELYLESSSDSDVDAGEVAAARVREASRPIYTSGAARAPSHPPRTTTDSATHQGRGEQTLRGRPARHSNGTNSDTTDSGLDQRDSDRKKRKSKRRCSRSPSHCKRSFKRDGKSLDRLRKSKKRRKRSHRRRSSSSSSRDGSESSNDDDDRSERAKILRLERAAAAAGLAPREVAALTSGKAVLKGAAPQPGDIFYDTRGDMDNLVYECLYGSNIASYHRVDMLGLAKGARAHLLLPGQVAFSRQVRGGDDEGDEDESKVGSLLASRYFGARSVALERSRRLRRVFMSEAPVLPGTAGPRRNLRTGEDVASAGGSMMHRSGGEAQCGWLLSQLEVLTTRRRPGSLDSSADGNRGFKMSMPMPSYLPLRDSVLRTSGPAGVGGFGWDGRQPVEVQAVEAAAEAGGESAEEWVLRRTREFNTAVREAPHDVKLWLRFAAFQDTVARLLARRGTEVAGSAAEKKLAILQRALEAHPGHPALLRGMMAASEHLVEPEDLLDRWERLLRRTPGEPALWRDYLARRRSAFALVTLSGLQAAYGNAMHALASERARQQRQADTAAAAERLMALSKVSALDRELVRLVLELAELELGAGASEVGVARIQALIEFHCFAPGSLDRSAAALGSGVGAGGLGTAGGISGLRLSAGALLRLFDNFWEGAAPRAGEEGAVGWANWYRKENEALWIAKSGLDDDAARRRRGQPRKDNDGDPQEDNRGGWTGWMELPPPPSAPKDQTAGSDGTSLEKEHEGVTAAGHGSSSDGEEGEDEEGDTGAEEGGVQLTEEELLAQLGLKLDEQLEEMQRQGVRPDILRRWLRTEGARSARDWRPLRPLPAALGSASPQGQRGDCEGEPGRGGDEGGCGAAADAHRVVHLDEIRDGIFPIEDLELKLDLILGCLSLLGVPLAVGLSPGSSGGGGAGSSSDDAVRSVPLMSSCLGCNSQSFLRLLPQQAALAACHAFLPPGLASTAAAAVGSAVGRGGGEPERWYLQDESRRLFVARLLRGLLVDGPYANQPQLCLAYLLVEASQANDVAANSGSSGDAAHTTAKLLLACVDRAREAARALLSERRNSLAMLMALAALEEAALQPRAARRARDVALAGAAALPSNEQHMLPLLVHQYAEAERTAAARAGSSSSALDSALRAHHVLRWFLGAWWPSRGAASGATASYVPYKPGQQVTREDVAAARRGFEARVPSLLSVKDGALDAPSASCLYLGGLFETLTGRLFPAAAGGLAAALTIFKHATAALPAPVRQSSGYHEALAVSYCGLVVSELDAAAAAASRAGMGGGGVQPARARLALLQALELYPHNSQLLALRLQLGQLAGGAAQCRLRRDLAAMAVGLRRRAESSLEALAEAEKTEEAVGIGAGLSNSASAAAMAAAVWWAQLASETAQPHADPRVSRLMERSATARHLAGCAFVWTAYLAHEARAGRGAQAKRVFLRAVREVPLYKDVWMLGFSLLGQGHMDAAEEGKATVGAGAAHASGLLTSREVSELMSVAADKGVRLRTDVYEVMLEHLAGQENEQMLSLDRQIQ